MSSVNQKSAKYSQKDHLNRFDRSVEIKNRRPEITYDSGADWSLRYHNKTLLEPSKIPILIINHNSPLIEQQPFCKPYDELADNNK